MLRVFWMAKKAKVKKPAQPVKIRREKAIRKPWEFRERVAERYMRFVFRHLEKRGEVSSAHHVGHVERVARYAGAYVELMGGSRDLQQQARISGWTHDRIRYPTEEVSHEPASGKFMGAEFAKRYGVKPTKRMTAAISKHGKLPALNRAGKNLVRDGVVFADKFFEANGAYIAFRRAMFMGEREDRRAQAKKMGLDLTKPKDRKEAAIEFTLDETHKRVKAFSDLSKIPKHMHPFIRYQVRWQVRLRHGLEKREPWAMNLAGKLFAEGLKKRPRHLDVMIKGYRPVGKEDAEFKREAMRYLNGELVKTFKILVKKPK